MPQVKGGTAVFIVQCPRPCGYNIIFPQEQRDMSNFTFHSRYGLITYAQCDGLDPSDVCNHFTSLGAECIIAREDHADGGTHLHVFADFERKRRFRRADIFDVRGYHPNIEPSRGNPGGYRRALPFFNGALSTDATRLTQLLAYVFKGAQGTDWNNVITAKTHSERVRIKSDRTRMIRSGNDSGVFKIYKDWFPMNHTLEYDEDEFGGIQVDGSLSAATRSSMGDYYVMDIFQPSLGTGSEEQIQFDPEATLYWHER